MMLPPPNVTGNLHLGHALTVAIEDALIRQRRMMGRDSVWIPGFDHAGLATQNIVEKLLIHQKGVNRFELGREKFLSFVNDWKDVKKNEMKDQLNRMGLYLDHSKEFFTTDDKSCRTVQTSFKRLFESGLIYRDNKLVHWSSQLETTLSDIEVHEIDGVKRYTRTNEVVSTRSLPQWFIKADDLARKAVDVVEYSSINMIPENYRRTWSVWLMENGVQDWCISRQSWWGHPIPAYKLIDAEDVQCNWIVADSLDEARDKLGSYEVMQDSDILDTWFSSSLIPLTLAGWPDDELFSQSKATGQFPLHIMETGFDILTYWVSKMVMMSLALVGEIPFKQVLLHGMICDSAGKKMSKSKGNVIDPMDLIKGANVMDLQGRIIDAYNAGILDETQRDVAMTNQKILFPRGIPACGADGLRAYLLSQDFQKEVVRTQIPQIDKVRRLMNKIWNVTRYVISVIESSDTELDPNFNMEGIDFKKLDESDLNLLKQLDKCVSRSHTNFHQDYLLYSTFEAVELFLSKHLSSTYIAHLKLYKANNPSSSSNMKVQLLAESLIISIKLLHPYMPHLTEFLYQKMQLAISGASMDEQNLDKIRSIVYQSYPSPNVVPVIA